MIAVLPTALGSRKSAHSGRSPSSFRPAPRTARDLRLRPRRAAEASPRWSEGAALGREHRRHRGRVGRRYPVRNCRPNCAARRSSGSSASVPQPAGTDAGRRFGLHHRPVRHHRHQQPRRRARRQDRRLAHRRHRAASPRHRPRRADRHRGHQGGRRPARCQRDLGRQPQVEVGDWILAGGNPFGLGGSVTVGIVSARGRDIGAGPFDDFLQLDAPINPGNSGGPTFNMNGQVIGINTAIVSPPAARSASASPSRARSRSRSSSGCATAATSIVAGSAFRCRISRTAAAAWRSPGWSANGPAARAGCAPATW